MIESVALPARPVTFQRVQAWLHPYASAKTVFLLGLLLALLFWGITARGLSGNENGDYAAYYRPVAQNLVAGRGLTTDGQTLATRYPPGFPLLLAGVFSLADTLHLPHEILVKGLLLFSNALAVALLFLLARQIWDAPASLLAALVWLSYLPGLWLTREPNSEVPYCVAFYACILVFCQALRQPEKRWSLFFVAGLLGGVAMLLRSAGLGIVAVLAVVLWLALGSVSWQRRMAFIVLLLCGNCLALLPWQTYVYRKNQRFVLLSTNLVPAIRDGLRFNANPKSYRQTVTLPADVSALMQRLNARAQQDQLDTAPQVIQALREEFQTSPVTLLKLFALKAARSWYGTDSGRREGALLLLQLLYFGIIVTSLYRALQLGSTARLAAVGVGLMLLYSWLLTTLVLSILRYLTPVIGLAFVLVPALWQPREHATLGAVQKATQSATA